MVRFHLMRFDAKLLLSAIFTMVVTAARIGMGFSNSIAGPTLLYLAENVQCDVSAVSYTFTGKSFGIMLGAMFGGYLKKMRPNLNQLMVLGISMIIMGIVSFIIPYIRVLWILVLDITIAGVVYGYLDAGLQALLLQIWGEEGSRSQIQLYHFTYSLGALFAPMIVKPFLLMSNRETSESSTAMCPNFHNSSDVTNAPAPLSHTVLSKDMFNPVGWAFIIAAFWMVGIGLIMVLLASFKIDRKLSRANGQNRTSSEDRPEEPLRDVIWVFIPVTGYFFCTVATESVFYNFIYPVTLCSDLNFSINQATLANSLFWMGLCAGRLTGVVSAGYFSPKHIILASIISSTIDSFLMVSLGEIHPGIALLVSFSHGYTTAMMYGSGVSWLSQITNVSGTYMFIFSIGNSLSGVFMLKLAGYLFDIHPFHVMVQVFIFAMLNGAFFGLSLYAGRKHILNQNRRSNSEYFGSFELHEESSGGEESSALLL